MPYMIPSGSIYTKLATVASSMLWNSGQFFIFSFSVNCISWFFHKCYVITCVIKTIYVKEIKYKINIYVEVEKKKPEENILKCYQELIQGDRIICDFLVFFHIF